MQVTHCQRWQTVMAVLSYTLGTLMVIAGARQHLHPWDLKHHAFFNGRPSLCVCVASHACTTFTAMSAAYRLECSVCCTCDLKTLVDCFLVPPPGGITLMTDYQRKMCCCAGAVSSTFVALGELLSGASYILTACLFLIPVSMSYGSSAGLCTSAPATNSLQHIVKVQLLYGPCGTHLTTLQQSAASLHSPGCLVRVLIRLLVL